MFFKYAIKTDLGYLKKLNMHGSHLVYKPGNAPNPEYTHDIKKARLMRKRASAQQYIWYLGMYFDNLNASTIAVKQQEDQRGQTTEEEIEYSLAGVCLECPYPKCKLDKSIHCTRYMEARKQAAGRL